MTAELYLIAPTDAEADAFGALLRHVLATPVEVEALRLPRGTRRDDAYRD